MQKVQKSVKALLKECGKNWIGKAYIRDSLGACPRRSAKGAKLGKKRLFWQVMPYWVIKDK